MPLFAASTPLCTSTKMAALGHTLPFYTGPKPTFPMDTTLAVIITIFLTALVTFIIILPGIRGKTVRNKPQALRLQPQRDFIFKSEGYRVCLDRSRPREETPATTLHISSAEFSTHPKQ